jgi:hypothetical protein
MAIKDKLTEQFLQALKEMQETLLTMLFKGHTFHEKGLSYYIEFRKENNTRVDFMFGPSDWNIEMIIYTSKGKFAFRDLLEIPTIQKWVNDNRYIQENGRNLKNELLWFVELLKVSLPLLE